MGLLNLDDPVSTYVPFPVANPASPEVPFTLRQLATRTSSICDNELYLNKNYFLCPNQDTTDLPLALAGEQIFNPADLAVSLPVFLQNVLIPAGKWHQPKGFSSYRPATRHEYSNVGTLLAVYVVERASKQPCPDFTARYQGKGTVLRPASYRKLFRPALSAGQFEERNERNPHSESYNVGVLMGFGYTSFIGHTGGDPGMVALLFFDLKSGIGRVLMLNTRYGDRTGEVAMYSIWEILENSSIE